MTNDERGFLTGGDVGRPCTHPTVIYLEHDGKVLLVDSSGNGPQQPVKGRVEADCMLRFPTKDEVDALGIEYEEKNHLCLRYNDAEFNVVKAYPKIAWPKIGHGKTPVHPTTPSILSCGTPFIGPSIDLFQSYGRQ